MGTFSAVIIMKQVQGLHCLAEQQWSSILFCKNKEILYRAALEEWKGRSDGNCVGDYSFHMAVTDFNENTKKEIKDMIEKEGIASFKTFMAYKGALMIDDRQMIGLMEEVKKHGGLINVHATNGDMIDYLIAKHRGEGKLSPLYHYLSQPEVTEAEASRTFCRYGAIIPVARVILYTLPAKVH